MPHNSCTVFSRLCGVRPIFFAGAGSPSPFHWHHVSSAPVSLRGPVLYSTVQCGSPTFVRHIIRLDPIWLERIELIWSPASCCPAQRVWWQQIWPGRPDSFKWLRRPPAAGTSCLTPAFPGLLRSSSVVVSLICNSSAPTLAGGSSNF